MATCPRCSSTLTPNPRRPTGAGRCLTCRRNRDRLRAGCPPLDVDPTQVYEAEQERLTRTVSLAQVGERLWLDEFKRAASQYLRDRIKPAGYSLKPGRGNLDRTVCLLLSDLHIGADLDARENPVPYQAVQEARRLEYVFRQAADYKTQYRDRSVLRVLFNGDVIHGKLHDLVDGCPLTEQMVAAWRYFRDGIAFLASVYPRVIIDWQSGNHGRDTARHLKRALSSKWDGHEWRLGWGLKEMLAGLPNVTFNIPFRAVSVIDLYGAKLLLTHGDTEVLTRDPDTKAADNHAVLDRINSTQLYGCRFDAAAFGHWHKPRYQPRNPKVLWNGCLVPPDGYHRSSGFVGEPCGQWLWESVEGYVVGDLRFCEVGESQDRDEKLGTIVKPFRFDP